MRKIFLICALLHCFSMYAQFDMYYTGKEKTIEPKEKDYAENDDRLFHMVEGGTFVSSEGKSYIVIPYEGETAQKLYNRIKSNVTLLYTSAKDVISTSENTVISINGIADNAGYRDIITGSRALFDIKYVIKFLFKDGKIRIDAPTILSVWVGSEPMPEYSLWCRNQKLFINGKRNPKRLGITEGFENTLNGIINSILKYDEIAEDW